MLPGFFGPVLSNWHAQVFQILLRLCKHELYISELASLLLNLKLPFAPRLQNKLLPTKIMLPIAIFLLVYLCLFLAIALHLLLILHLKAQLIQFYLLVGLQQASQNCLDLKHQLLHPPSLATCCTQFVPLQPESLLEQPLQQSLGSFESQKHLSLFQTFELKHQVSSIPNEFQLYPLHINQRQHYKKLFFRTCMVIILVDKRNLKLIQDDMEELQQQKHQEFRPLQELGDFSNNLEVYFGEFCILNLSSQYNLSIQSLEANRGQVDQRALYQWACHST